MTTREIYVFVDDLTKKEIITNDLNLVALTLNNDPGEFKVINPNESCKLLNGESYSYEELKEMRTIFVKPNNEEKRVEEVKYSYKFPQDFMKFMPVRYYETLDYWYDIDYSYEELKSMIKVEV